MKYLSITKRIVIVISAAIILIGIVFTSLLVTIEAKKIERVTKQKIRILAELEAMAIASDFNLLVNKANNLATYFENLIEEGQADREGANMLIKRLVLNDSLLFSAAVVFEENNFDGKDDKYKNTYYYGESGRFTSWWYGFDKNLTFGPLPNFDSEDWYLKIAENRGLTLLEPYFYPLNSGEKVLFITAGRSIIVNDRFLGITVTDMSVNHIRSKISDISVFMDDYTCLISPSGLYATHPIKEKVGKRIAFQDLGSEKIDSLRTGKVFEDKHISEYIFEEVYDFYVPLKINHVHDLWYLRISVPTEVVKKQISTFRKQLVLTYFVMLVIILILLHIILYSKLKPINRITDLITQLSAEGVEYAKPLKLKEDNEIGLLVKSYNNLIESLKGKNQAEENLRVNQQLLKQKNREYEVINEKLRISNAELNDKNKQLYDAKERAEESDQLKAEFLRNMSHEVRTPLNGILGFSDILRNEDISTEDKIQCIDVINSCSQQLLSIIDDILEISFLETKQIKPKFSKVDITEVLMELYLIFSMQAKKKGLDFNLQLAHNGSCMLVTDKNKLLKALDNIIENAIKYTEKGKIDIGYKHHDNSFEIFVKDTGIGIEKENFEKVFVRFSQGNIDQTMEYGGLGLGLSIAKENIEIIGGNISLESKRPGGTTFFISLPDDKSIQGIGQDSEEFNNKKLDTKQKMKVLIVEDEEINCLFLKTILYEKFGNKIDILLARSGKEALEIFSGQTGIDIILMDIKMPEMDGFEVTQKIRETNKNIPIIAQSAYTSVRDERKAIDVGCNAFIPKPIDARYLEDLILDLI
jgi:signal transduction histidine kinase/CheY-like chemotaxis protein